MNVVQLLKHGDDPPVRYTMDFTRKARFVLDGDKTEKPDISTYAGVEYKDCLNICVIERAPSIRHSQCLLASSIFTETLYRMWC